MGNVIKVLVRDTESVNFDKIVRLTLEIVHVRKLEHDGIVVVRDGEHDVDIEGEAQDREYWKRDGRSMTELYALRVGLGTSVIRVGLGEDAGPTRFVLVESPIAGLASLCQSLAENHGKVPGVKGGGLYRRDSIPSLAKGLTVLPNRSSEIVERLVKAVAAALRNPNPVAALMAMEGPVWDKLTDAVASAERSVYEKARDMARAIREGRCADGGTFPLAKASGNPPPQGLAISTTNPNLMKHLWGVIKAMGPSFPVAVAVVSHPETGRVAVLCSTLYDIDIAPVAKALKERFPETAFDVNLERKSVIWDPRSETAPPAKALVAEIVAARLAIREEARTVPTQRFGATFGDALRQKPPQKRR